MESQLRQYRFRRNVLDAHQEAVLHRVHVDLGRQRAAVTGQHLANVIAARVGRVQAFPAHQLGPPGDIGILAVDKEIGIEEFAVEGNIVDHGPPVERGGRGSAEDVLVLQVVPVVHFLAAAVEMAQHGVEVDTGGIHHGLFGNLEVRRHGQQLPADGADARVELAGVHQGLDEVGEQQDVGIQGHHPVSVGEPDGLVLGGGEADIVVVVIDAAAVLELFQNVDGAVGGGIVHHDDLFVGVALS